MSELKEHIFCDIDEVFPRGYCGPLLSNEARPYYLKSEADKVIADLEESHKKEVEQLLMEIMKLKHSLELASNECCSISERGVKNARHHKYKRGLAMASICRLRARWFGDNAFYKKEQWALDWHRCWLELAEKFKEAK